MTLTLVLFVVGIVLFVLTLVSVVIEKWPDAGTAAIASIFVFGIAIFSVAPAELGVGVVSDEIDSLAVRLDDRGTYQTASSVKDGETYVLLVKAYGTSDFRCPRVNELPPEIFTMVDGQPVAVE